jgi:hypothetical protein
MKLEEVTKEEVYNKVNPLNVEVSSYFTTNDNRTYLDLRRESARVQNCDFTLKSNRQLIARTSIDYNLPYDQQITKYFIVK